MFDQETWMLIRELYKQGMTRAELARRFEIDPRTVDRYLGSETPPRYPTRSKPAELAPHHLAHVERRLAICKTIRATTLYREVKELGYGGSYVSFARRVRILRPEEAKESLVRFETDPGVQVQMDWAELGGWPLGDEIVDLKTWVGVLGFSRAVAFRFATNKTRATTLRLTPLVLNDLGGAPKEILTDRDPAVVIGDLDGQAVFASEWVDLAMSLRVTPRACRPYRAKTKGKVERVIREIKEDFLPWLTGQPLPMTPGIADYEALANKWAKDVFGTRRHRTTGRIIKEACDKKSQIFFERSPSVCFQGSKET